MKKPKDPEREAQQFQDFSVSPSELGTFFIFSSPSSPSCLYISPRTPFAQELPEHLGHLSCIEYCMACQQPTTTTAATAAHPPIKISGSTTGGGAPPARLSWANIALIGGVASCSAEALTYPLGTRTPRAFTPPHFTPYSSHLARFWLLSLDWAKTRQQLHYNTGCGVPPYHDITFILSSSSSTSSASSSEADGLGSCAGASGWVWARRCGRE